MKWQALTANTRLLTVAYSATSAVVGGAVAYVAASKILEKKYRAIADKEIQEAKVFYQGFYSRPILVEEPSPEEEHLLEKVAEAVDLIDGMPRELVEKAMEAVGNYSPESDELSNVLGPQLPEKPEPQVINVFNTFTPPSDAVVDALMAERDPEKPYIISKAEFFENEGDFEQKQFTFYEGGRQSVLVDDQEEYSPIQNTDLVVGDENLLHFGYGSGDMIVVYVRNENAEMDLYVTKSSGDYALEVMGFDDSEPHIQHSQRRFRHQDE